MTKQKCICGQDVKTIYEQGTKDGKRAWVRIGYWCHKCKTVTLTAQDQPTPAPAATPPVNA